MTLLRQETSQGTALLRQAASQGTALPTFFTTVSGRSIDLFAPKVEDIVFSDIAEQLAKVKRYNGATPGVEYSVAEHSVRGADFILRVSKQAAAYFLCHDFHEAYLGDDTTPKKRTLDRVAEQFGTASGVITEAFARVTDRFDAVIHEAAGLAWPPPSDIAALVHQVDRAMLVAEWRDLRPEHPLPPGYEDVEPLPIKIVPQKWDVARSILDWRMRELLPALSKPTGEAEAQTKRGEG